VHVDEDLAQAAVLVFAGAQIDLVAADDGLLGVALAPFRQLLAVGLDDLLSMTTFSTIFSAMTCAFSMVEPRFQRLGGLVLVVIVMSARSGGERLRQLGAVAVERVGLQRPATRRAS
jgi:hypothetical protein